MRFTAMFLIALTPVFGSARAAEIQMTPVMQRDMTKLITSFGYNCPLVKMAFTKGQDPFGLVFKVYCGPASGKGVYNSLVFRLTGTQDNRWRVKPWK